MKQIIVLLGQQGAGKTTLSKLFHGDFIVIEDAFAGEWERLQHQLHGARTNEPTRPICVNTQDQYMAYRVLDAFPKDAIVFELQAVTAHPETENSQAA